MRTQQAERVSEWPVSAKRWALIIGVDEYKDEQISPLKGAANDAKALLDTLVRYAGFPRDQIILLATDQPVERQPTRVNILRRLSNLRRVVPKDGLLLVAFSGHGMERESQAYILPSDAQIGDDIAFLEDTAISVKRAKELIRATGVRQVVFILDACRNDPGGRADVPNRMTDAYKFDFDIRNREVDAFATLYSTGIGDRAYEYTEKKQGYFTWAIVEAMQGQAANEKGEITLSALVGYLQEAVPKRVGIDLGKQQKPFAIIEGFKAEELVIAVATPKNIPKPEPLPPPPIDSTQELNLWNSIKNSNDTDVFKAYLQAYPNGQFAVEARTRLQSLSASSTLKTETPSEIGISPIIFSGIWDMVVESPQGKRASTLVIKQQQYKMSAVLKSERGERPFDSITVKGDEITMIMTVQFQGSNMVMTYTGKIGKEAMKGIVDFGGLAQGEWTATPRK